MAPPQENHLLLGLDKFILTSHTAARTKDYEINTYEVTTEKINIFLKGE